MDPNPIKHPAVLLAHVRDQIEPALATAGFQFQSRNKPRDPGRTHLWIDYSRGEELISLRWDRWQATLSLTALDARGEIHKIAQVGFSGTRSASELMERADQFVQGVQQSAYLNATNHAEQRHSS